jgi:hypothetical protein
VSIHDRIVCDVCRVPKPLKIPPKNIPKIRCQNCVRLHGWPEPIGPGPLHTRPLKDRKSDPDIKRFHDELAAYRKRQKKHDVPHVPTKGNFRAFVV